MTEDFSTSYKLQVKKEKNSISLCALAFKWHGAKL